MPTESGIVMLQKATVYDIRRILEEDPDKTYTLQELRRILDDYVIRVEG